MCRFATTPLLASTGLLAALSCGGGDEAPAERIPLDVHSHAQPDKARVRHVSLDLSLDFEQRVIAGTATLDFTREPGVSQLHLDSSGLQIERALGDDGEPRDVAIGEPDAVRGAALVIALREGDTKVVIHYRTGPGAQALQWLSPEQTAGGALPFLYTQGQAILTRSWIPLQDSPGVRVTYDATVSAPPEMQVVMSAEERAQEGPGRFRFAMSKPIPPYLIALACGDIARREVSARCAIHADPSVVEAAAAELEDVEAMLAACENAFGPYRWGRYDVLILPPAFPFGGMENPTLTFATPTILAGDKSLVALVAHELAHSWSGNLVTNATWRDFWLNEGFTVYLEQRIMEIVYGQARAEMETLIGLDGLREELLHLPERDQVLHIDLAGRNPDDGMTAVPYDKGAAFLRRIEHVVGRERFDEFLSAYFGDHAFQSITTEDFVAYLEEQLLQDDSAAAEQIDVATWLTSPGMPAEATRPRSAAFEEVDTFRARWLGEEATLGDTESWITHQWLHFFAGMEDLTEDELRRMDHDFDLTATGNSEVLAAWLRLAVLHEFEPVYERLEEFLVTVGRRKYLKPLYEALIKTEAGKERALAIYRRARPRYHAISRRTLDDILGW